MNDVFESLLLTDGARVQDDKIRTPETKAFFQLNFFRHWVEALVTTSKNSSLFEMVDTNKIGVVVEPENKEELTVAIKRLMNFDKEKISSNAFTYAQQNFSIDTVFSRFTQCLI